MAGTMEAEHRRTSPELKPLNRLLAMLLVIAVYLAVIGAVGALNRWLG